MNVRQTVVGLVLTFTKSLARLKTILVLAISSCVWEGVVFISGRQERFLALTVIAFLDKSKSSSKIPQKYTQYSS